MRRMFGQPKQLDEAPSVSTFSTQHPPLGGRRAINSQEHASTRTERPPLRINATADDPDLNWN